MTVQIGNIAGTALVDQSLENWNRIMQVNATGVFLGTKSVIPAIDRRPVSDQYLLDLRHSRLVRERAPSRVEGAPSASFPSLRRFNMPKIRYG